MMGAASAATASAAPQAAHLRGAQLSRASRAARGGARQASMVIRNKAVQEPVEVKTPTEAAGVKAIKPVTGTGRKKVVVLGSGWGAISFVKALNADSPYDVTLVSPRNYFLYTPLLPGAATGAVEDRSIVEPIRQSISEKNYKYYEASCLDVNAADRKILCRAADLDCEEATGGSCPWHTFELEYDYLVTSVGAIPNTFGVPGVQENAMFFKEIVHAAKFRREVNERFERATLPDVPEDRIKDLLTFVVIGAGPTGVELAAELYDMVYEDIVRMYPSRLMPHVSIKIIDLQEKILSAYDRRIAEYATEFFGRANIDCLLNTVVKEVRDGELIIADKDDGIEQKVPFGLAVWCTGIKLNPLCEKIMDAMPEGAQENRRSIATDKSLRVKGSEGTIFAIGDCATIERPRSLAKAEALYAEAAACDIKNGVCEENLDLPRIKSLLTSACEEFPHLEELANQADEKFPNYVSEGATTMEFDQFKAMLEDCDNGLRALPATAQVAKQEGEYLADFFNVSFGDAEKLKDPAARFDYNHKGSLAYIGKNAAVADIPGFTIVKGIAAGLIWKGFETISQVSLRQKILVASDMVRTRLFGRDISRIN